VIHAHVYSSGESLPDDSNFLGQGSATINPFAYKSQDKSIEKAATTAKGRALRDCAFCAHLALIDDEYGEDTGKDKPPADSLNGVSLEQVERLVEDLGWSNAFHVKALITGGVLNVDNWNNAAEVRAREFKNLVEDGHNAKAAMTIILAKTS